MRYRDEKFKRLIDYLDGDVDGFAASDISHEKNTETGTVVYIELIRNIIFHNKKIPDFIRYDLVNILSNVTEALEQGDRRKAAKVLSDGFGITKEKGGKRQDVSNISIWENVLTEMNKGVDESKSITNTAKLMDLPRSTVSDKYYEEVNRVNEETCNTNLFMNEISKHLG